jgi:hypothetical protein
MWQNHFLSSRFWIKCLELFVGPKRPFCFCPMLEHVCLYVNKTWKMRRRKMSDPFLDKITTFHNGWLHCMISIILLLTIQKKLNPFFTRTCKTFLQHPKEGVVVGSAHDQCDEERFYGNGKNIISRVLFFSFQS